MADEYVSINCDVVFMTQSKALIDIGLAGQEPVWVPLEALKPGTVPVWESERIDGTSICIHEHVALVLELL